MKAMLKNWIWGVIALVALLGGCAAHPHMAEPTTDFYFSNNYASTNGSEEVFSQFVRSISDSGADEVWIIPRSPEEAASSQGMPDSGMLLANVRGGEMPLPLRHMEVNASVNGFIGTVEVTQEFDNSYTEKIEATYVFPLPRDAAVNEFIMTIGRRRIRGIIRERKDAEAIYEEAKRQGYKATLLAEERPNIFRQSIANIEPGNEIDVKIKYFQTLSYRDGWFEFLFPMAAGPQFKSQTDDADVSLRVDVEAGSPIQELKSKTHAISRTVLSPQHVLVRLKPTDSVLIGISCCDIDLPMAKSNRAC